MENKQTTLEAMGYTHAQNVPLASEFTSGRPVKLTQCWFHGLREYGNYPSVFATTFWGAVAVFNVRLKNRNTEQ